MSERGRGRRGGSPYGGGRGGGRTPPYGGGRGDGRTPPYGGGRGGGRTSPSDGRGRGYQSPGGRGRGTYSSGGSPSYNAPPMYHHQQQSMEVSSMTREVEQKLSLQPSTSANPPARPQPAQQSSPPVQPPVATIPAHLAGPSTSTQPPRPPPVSSKSIRPPPRPDYGKLGRKCVVRANHFLVQVADRDVHHYDVTISPEVLSKKVCRLIIQQLVNNYRLSHLGGRGLAYDGRKSAYTAGALPFTSKEFVIIFADDNGGPRREKEFKVSIKFAAKADIHHLKQFLQSRQSDVPQETIQALDVVLRTNPSAKYEVVGRSLFHHTFAGDAGLLSGGLEYWRGYYQSLRPTQMGLALNIDMSARAFYESVFVSDYVLRHLNLRDHPQVSLSDQDHSKVRKVLKGVKVEATHQGRRYRITGLTPKSSSQMMFPVDGTDGMISVDQYFNKKYNIVLAYTKLPAIQCGNSAKPVYLPMEICKIVPGQRYTKMLNGRQVTEMLRATCQRPKERQNGIQNIVKVNKYADDDLVHEFGIGVDARLTTIEARVLNPPTLRFHASGKESRVDPRVGQWNMIDKKMINPAHVYYWTCVSFSQQIPPERLVDGLLRMCISKGMTFAASLVPFRQARPDHIETTLRDIHRESMQAIDKLGEDLKIKHLQLLLVILPDGTGQYGRIKRLCEIDLGIVSQCCHPKNLRPPSIAFLENLSLKINVKVGGRNSVLEMAVSKKMPFLTDKTTIVFGADVTHPQPGEDSSPSIAAVVASMDWPEVAKYRGIVSAQPHRQEIITDLYTEKEDSKRGVVRGGMIMDLLKAFYAATKIKPERIIFYRDGVSEGQFNQVLLEEMDAIRKACVALQSDYMPRVTFVVVQKRHHTRLFPSNHDDRTLTDRSGNILPGTVVDTNICHPTEFDFYLCSHAGIKGTSRPAHYHVLYDENNFTADGIQNVTNYLCYTYVRCTRSVSLVPPAYYAHLAAFRARYYMENDVDVRSANEGGEGGAAAHFRQLPKIHENVSEVMFYC
ncbi:protein argonaute 5-like [Solanum pennellii]|uniref:Protein argonaute 5-like n=1 Tax=Solanum pennellii TaxID=28526 RepID=A0ABM1GYS6_SOLPN|nr:protein argonaute 5-like [Solanum pennellii]